MSKQIFCQKLQQEAEAFDTPPLPGALGKKIMANISKPAWSQWLAHQTMLINEYRLNLGDPKAREFLRQEMDNFLFKGGSQKPAGYVPPEK